ncbi:MAG: GxxExxY protein [Lentimonas sp.]
MRQRGGLVVERQKPVSIEFEGEHFDEGFRADLVVNGLVIIELKSIEKLSPVHKNNTDLFASDGSEGWLFTQFR